MLPIALFAFPLVSLSTPQYITDCESHLLYAVGEASESDQDLLCCWRYLDILGADDPQHSLHSQHRAVSNIHLSLAHPLPMHVCRSWLLWCVLVLVLFLVSGIFTVGYSSIFLFINNSVTFDKLGSINGVAMMLTSLTRYVILSKSVQGTHLFSSMLCVCRAIAPVVFGSIYSASLSDAARKIGYPLDYHLVFLLFSIIFLVTVLMVACLPVSINRQKKQNNY